jgi:hypothetical protein
VTKNVTSEFTSDSESIEDGLLLAVIEAWPKLNPARRKMIAAILGQGRPY